MRLFLQFYMEQCDVCLIADHFTVHADVRERSFDLVSDLGDHLLKLLLFSLIFRNSVSDDILCLFKFCNHFGCKGLFIQIFLYRLSVQEPLRALADAVRECRELPAEIEPDSDAQKSLNKQYDQNLHIRFSSLSPVHLYPSP